jgi:RHS repeat-associated protein
MLRIKQGRPLAAGDNYSSGFRLQMGDPSLHNSENRTILDPSGRVRQGLSFTTAGSCDKAWPIRVVEKTRSDTRPHGLPVGSGTGVAAHPVAQLTEQVTLARSLRQAPHRPLHSRTHTFHTIYDGDGRRVKKYVPSSGETTVFVYDAAGKLVAEYSTIVASSQDAKVAYLTNDHLGSPRINTDLDGDVISRHDYHPFGEEIATSQRTTGLGYTADTIRKQFTGYERDNELDLDFAQARVYAFSLGRFVSPDPLLSSGRVENPQTWNRYPYVLGNPMRFVDPSGLYEWDESAGGELTDEQLRSISEDKSVSKRLRKTARRHLEFRNRFRQSLDEARALANSGTFDEESHRETVVESVNSYGTENDGSNVRVGVGESRGGTSRLDQDTGLVHLTFRKSDGGKSLVRTIAHEGRHVADANEYWSEGTPGGGLDRTHYDRERRAYFVSSYVAQAQGLSVHQRNDLAPSDKYRIWNKGWEPAEREEKRSRGVNNYIEKHYGYTPTSQGDTYSQDRTR